ncbi:MAG TPA: ferritin family protein [Sedimentisphaerales bacterium]|nr:ferritin family protein [Sedimentisphaerales bacterium]
MNIMEFAQKKERFSIELYTELAAKTKHEGLRNIMLMLAEEEKQHNRLLLDVAREMPAGIQESPAALRGASNVFRQMKKSAAQFVFPGHEVELYSKARGHEKESIEFYLQKARELPDDGHRGVFSRLADEEQKHFILLDSICDFVSRPLSYLENAEFTHLDGYGEDAF